MTKTKEEKKQAREEKDFKNGVKAIRKEVGLGEDEEVLAFARRHWVELFRDSVLPVTIGLIALLIAGFRAMGGTFFAMGAQMQNPFDVANSIISVAVVSLFVFISLAHIRAPKKQQKSRQYLTILAVALAAVFLFRYMGVRFLIIDPQGHLGQGLDVYNLALLGVGVLGVGYCIYLALEWKNDFLILTNRRVISWNERFFGKNEFRQVAVEDIQKVSFRTSTYFEHYLKFGAVSVTSASYGNEVKFDNASHPQKIEQAISKKLGEVRGQFNPLREVVESTVYGIGQKKPMLTTQLTSKKNLLAEKISAEKVPPMLRWLLEPNPYIEGEGTKITWRPHRFWLAVMLLKPIALLIIGFALILFLGSLYTINAGFLVLATIALLLVVFAWSAWVIEDERNEQYILTPSEIVDIEQKPFGPMARNSATLDKIQNIEFRASFIGQIIGYGDVLIETAGAGEPLTFLRLPKPREVVATIEDYKIKHKQREKQRTLNDTVQLLKHYHDIGQPLVQKRHDEIKSEVQAARTDIQEQQQTSQERHEELRNEIEDIKLRIQGFQGQGAQT